MCNMFFLIHSFGNIPEHFLYLLVLLYGVHQSCVCVCVGERESERERKPV